MLSKFYQFNAQKLSKPKSELNLFNYAKVKPIFAIQMQFPNFFIQETPILRLFFYKNYVLQHNFHKNIHSQHTDYQIQIKFI